MCLIFGFDIEHRKDRMKVNDSGKIFTELERHAKQCCNNGTLAMDTLKSHTNTI